MIEPGLSSLEGSESLKHIGVAGHLGIYGHIRVNCIAGYCRALG